MFKYALILAVAAATAATAAWQTPVNLGANVNSSSNDWYPVLTPDGWTMFFVSDRPGGYGDADLYRSNRSSTGWSAPVNLGTNVNASGVDTGLSLNADGSRMYFASDCAGGLGNLDIWYAPVTNGQPGAKVHLPAPINTTSIECCPVLAPDGNTLYFSSGRPGGYGGDDLYTSTWNGSVWSEPVNMGATLNTAGYECPRWISSDGNTLLFLTNRTGGQGSYDLWTTTKSGGTWGTPVNLGAVINSSANEWGAGFRCNNGQVGGIIYFDSARSGGNGGFDIWQATDDASYDVEPASVGRVKAEFR
jgi:Tol biopolymer transport system component